MRRLIVILLVLIFSVLIGLKIAEDPGYAIFAYRHWTVEMPLWFAVLSVILGLSLLFFILRFFDAIDATWVSWKNWLRLRRKHKAYSKTNRGLIDLVEANWKSAETYVMQGVDQSDAPLINFLAAAKAAHEQGAYERRDIYLRKAYDLSSQTHVAVGLMQAQLQLKQGKLEQAFATLNHLRAQSPKQVLLLKLLERVCVRLNDWANLLKLIPALRKARIISAEQMTMLEISTYGELLQVAAKSGSSSAVKDLWKTIPRKLQKNSTLICCYVKQLSHYSDAKPEIEELITKTLKYEWQPELVKVYGTLASSDALKQLKIAETWQKHFGPQSLLYLTLARLSMRAQLWGKARHYYEESLKLESLPESYLEYGNLLAQLDETVTAMQVYKEGLKKLLAEPKQLVSQLPSRNR